jgi:23S rRNA maturation-related 3'-5' exoribonuclease YhaM
MMVYDRFDFTKYINIDPSNITHNILSHHGMREWGSPVAPATKEAWILHLCDNMSARLDDCNKHDKIQ